MKIVLLIGPDSPPINWFANTITSQHEVALIIREVGTKVKKEKVQKNEKNKFFHKALKYINYRITNYNLELKIKKFNESNLNYYNEHFGNDWQSLNISCPIVKCANINDENVSRMLTEIEPDLILDHGTSLIKKSILNLSPLALNLHWGLSPYYRGVECTLHALMNWDPYNIGVTIHKLSVEIDGGDIVAQKRVIIDENDTVDTINMRLTFEGTKLLVKIIEELKMGQKPTFIKQTQNVGFLIQGLHWDLKWVEWRYSLTPEKIRQMLQKPSRRELPIV